MNESITQPVQTPELKSSMTESSVRVQYAVLGLITDTQGRVLLLNQRNKDPAINTLRAWRTPGGRVEIPAELRYPLGGHLRATPIPAEFATDFTRLVHIDDVEDYMDLAERSLSEEYLMSECQRELVEEINEQIKKLMKADGINVDEMPTNDPRFITSNDIKIEAGTSWLNRKPDLKPGDANTNRKYFKVRITDDAQRKVDDLVQKGRAIWFDANQKQSDDIPVSNGGRRAQQIATSGVFTDLSKPKE